MTQRVEVNQPVDCEIHIGNAERPAPDEHQARTCPQCKRATWLNTSTCMWCGHDRTAKPLRWLVTIVTLLLLAVNFPRHLLQL